MFDFSFAEIALIVIVAVIFIGPEELPVVIKAVAKALRGIRALSHELKQALDDLSRESGLQEVAKEFHQETQMIQGDDGQFYEAYDVKKVLPGAAKYDEKSH